ncbi:DEAD/DEAH box helicase [Aquirufa aurantiipilula]|uniref:DEAD/DEAH box helicase n=1 Tax=Aquirufa aurantiipilula TaxID=2696561 RepID=A0ABT6BLY7_9BACT|nr:DEAD/DEAH box helicase [Aquirufa aurantiipilula]MDF5691491.1 DEAD/DEAH box helicase [Aquirufa aurantiipilula]
MNIEENLERLKKVNRDKVLQGLVAQADARYILFNTSEQKENFPAYTIQDDKLNILALYYLEIGCSFAENKSMENAREPMERGASILEFIHGSESNKTELSNYYCLISAMAYYVSFQYSKSFILIKKVKTNTLISNLIALFLERNYTQLNETFGKIVVDITYSDDFISKNFIESKEEGELKIYEITIAKSLNGFINYFQTGNEEYLNIAKRNLQNLKEIVEINSEPSIWWIVRLLLLVAEGFDEASLWNSLKGYFNIQSTIIKKYIQSLVYLSPRGIHELFITQRKSLSKVLNKENKGCVVTIPTSSGKTRIAELAILDCITKNDMNKVLYIAPFRSLAFEIENSLDKILGNVDISLSHLYGGSLYSRLDEKIIEESDVIIATPEKAKAIIRGNRGICNQIKLIIIDEGHLLGANKRLIVNEIFYEELRFFIEKNGGRFLVLSAVLPNAEDLSQWLTNSTETIFKDTWRPSDERLGILDWNGNQVNLNWMNNDEERPSFNNKFILSEQQPLKPGQRKNRFFPSNKNEAVASTTYKLRSFGTALIFVGVKKSVFIMAACYLKCLGNEPEDYKWSNKFDWKAFELASIETYGENNNWLLYAKKGIICHHGGLHSDVRLPLERLMRNDKPLVIISTSTLGQGVNLGVSSIIFSTIYQANIPVTARDFWNIAGRAGRAFVDHEGKILVAVDSSDSSSLFKNIKKQKTTFPDKYRISKASILKLINEQILSYFNKEKIDNASSGILTLFKLLQTLTLNNGIQFEVLLQLIAENKIEEIGENAKDVDIVLDWIDDTLLALQDLNNPTEDIIDFGWIEDFFRNSLAYIQAKKQIELTEDNLIKLIEARVKGIIQKVGQDKAKWKSIINSGIPLNSDLFVESKMEEIILTLFSFGISENIIDDKIILANSIIKILDKMPLLTEIENTISNSQIELITSKWLKAEHLSSLNDYEGFENVITDLFTFKLPWVFNGIAQKLRAKNMDDDAEIIEELSMLIEIGVPNLKALKIYQSGIRSRVSATELSYYFEDELWNKSIKDYKTELILNKELYKSQVSEVCKEWIELIFQSAKTNIKTIKSIPAFKFGDVYKKTNILIAKEINGKQHLTSPDLSFFEEIGKSKIDFTPVNRISGIFFQYDFEDHIWKMIVENPYIQVN